jgi:hypothetical protein
MNPPDDWQPPPCKHGIKPTITQDWVDLGQSGTFRNLTPGRKEFRYNCPTPAECWAETWQQVTEQ